MAAKPPTKELLPRRVRLLLGATSPGVSDARLREAVGGKIVLITGASSGVGEATARRLGAAGATVLLVARRAGLLEEVRSGIAAGGGSAYCYPTDMADAEAVAAMASEVLERHGQVDVLVSNAGLSIRRWVSDSYERFHDFERTIDVNYLGPVRLLLALLPSMRARRSGHIVNIATTGVDMPPIEWSAYIASKTAFEMWLRGVAPEALADGVTTTSIHLQLVRSPMLGPFRMWRYLPGMSPDEAAGMVSRAIVSRPRTISPWWARISAPIQDLAQAPIERALSRHAQIANPASRPDSAAASRYRAVARAAVAADEALGGLLTIRASQAVRPVRPDRLARVAQARRRFGLTPAFTAAQAAELYPQRRAVIDESGEITFAELDARARSQAAALHRHLDLDERHRVAIMARNHRGFVEGAVAASRLGCDLVLLNYDYAGPQLGDVLEREQVDAAIHDAEFKTAFEHAGFEGPRILSSGDGDPPLPTLDALAEWGGAEPPAPREPGRFVLMTSGTTGTPKGVARELDPRTLIPLAWGGLRTLSRIKPAPRAGEPFLVAPPLFHMYGFYVWMGAHAFGSPIVIRTRFDPEMTLADIERHRPGVLFAVPTMLKRIMDLPESERRHDTSSLRMVLCGAAPLAPDLALTFMDTFGDILYNGYGATETGSGTLATPADMRAAPGTVGRPVLGAGLRILDDEGVPVAKGETGRIFVRTPTLFEGYSGGGSREMIDGYMRSGDVGHLDKRGRLFIEGRDDDMILSGGENVYPQEVEELLAGHEAIADAAVIGVPDEEFGQRLAAFVVAKPGAKPTAEELRDFVKARLARYKVPREIQFLDELPRTSTGKLRRAALS